MAWNGLAFTAAAELAGAARSGAAIGFQQTVLSGIGVVAPCSSRRLSRATSWAARVLIAARSRSPGGARCGHCATLGSARAISARLDELYVIGGGPGANRPHGSRPRTRRTARGRMAGRGGARGRGRPRRQPASAARASAPTSGSARISTRFPAAGASTARSGSSPAIEAVERVGAGSVVVFRGEEVGCIGSRALVASGDQLAGVLPRAPRRAGSGAGDGGRAARGRDRDRRVRARRARPRRAGGSCGDDADGRPRGRARRRRGGDPARARRGARRSRERWRRSGRSTSSPGGANVIPSRVRLSLDVRAPDAERLDALVAAVGFEPDYRVEPAQFGGASRSAPASAIGRVVCRSSSSLWRRARRRDPRRVPGWMRRCSSCAA